MGMYTSIVHPVTGKDIQIKTGQDECERFKLGDTVPWEPNPHYPGSHVDGAYRGYGCSLDDTWVIVKDCIVVAVLDAADVTCDADMDPETYLVNKYGITPPDPALWSEAEWAEQKKCQREAALRAAQWAAEADRQGLTGTLRTSYMLGRVLAQRMNYAALGREVFQVEPL